MPPDLRSCHLERLGHDEAAGAGRVVYFSSGQVLGLAEGERLPDYFPVDDAHSLCAAGIAATGPSLVMAARFAPSVPVRDAACFQGDPWRSLFD
ncbi:MAG TPA: hypothetical protein VI365_14975, partial [Trebonia sp.]